MARHQLTRQELSGFVLVGLMALAFSSHALHAEEPDRGRPNILFCLADDQSYPHASAYGEPVIETPVFDRVAREGVLFTQAYCASPSCTPSRSAILTGQDIWRLGEGGQLFGTLPAEHPVYTDLLTGSGYHVGYMDKGWAPGNDRAGGRGSNPAGTKFGSFREFLAEAPEGCRVFVLVGPEGLGRRTAAVRGLGRAGPVVQHDLAATLPAVATLEERLGQGKKWTRLQWAQARLAARFEHRIPADVIQKIERVNSAVETYIDNYNVLMDRLKPAAGAKPFRKGLKLISHWGLRDEIRGQYAKGAGGLAKQRQISQVMERIIHQQIPQVVINSGEVEWDPAQNRVRSPGAKTWREAPREPDTRYRHLLAVFRAYKEVDPFYPRLPTYIDRIFNKSREIPEKKMRKLLTDVLSAPVAKKVGALIAKRLGRKLEPFDLWYTGFQPKSNVNESDLDAQVRKRYPTVKDFEKDIPGILKKLGFSEETAAFLGRHIVVDAARGAGHAHGAQHRDGKAHLRTRLSKGGMDYKGFNIAIHELGHNVEQVFSMSRIDHTELEGVPNTGFTEAFAFLFQARDLQLLGQAVKDPDAEAMRTINRFWHAYEIAGVALLDMDIWHWMYKNPDATPAQLREATVRLAKELWNRYYAPVFGINDAILPAIYSHVIAFGLYTPDYPLGFLITFQVEQYVKTRNMATEMERMCRLGRLAPDVWMQQAVGAQISARPLLEGTEKAVEKIK